MGSAEMAPHPLFLWRPLASSRLALAAVYSSLVATPFSVSAKPLVHLFSCLLGSFAVHLALGRQSWVEPRTYALGVIHVWAMAETPVAFVPQTGGLQANPSVGVMSFGLSISFQPAPLQLRQTSLARCWCFPCCGSLMLSS